MNNIDPAFNPHASLSSQLTQLRLPTFAREHAALAAEALRGQQSHQQFLQTLTLAELAQRDKRRHALCIRNAHFPVLKELADFDFAAVPSLHKPAVQELARGGYIRKAESILAIGGSGLGKSHIATSLGLAACRQGLKVRFWGAATLVNDLIEAQDRHAVERFIAQALRHQLIILDEFGFIPFSPLGASLLFQFCSALYERVAVILTSNLKFAEWTQILHSESLTAALLDRLTHRAHILEFSGSESFRLKQRLAKPKSSVAVT